MDLKKLNKQIVSFCALGLLFLGSLFYFVSVAFENNDYLEGRQALKQEAYHDLLEQTN